LGDIINKDKLYSVGKEFVESPMGK